MSPNDSTTLKTIQDALVGISGSMKTMGEAWKAVAEAKGPPLKKQKMSAHTLSDSDDNVDCDLDYDDHNSADDDDDVDNDLVNLLDDDHTLPQAKGQGATKGKDEVNANLLDEIDAALEDGNVNGPEISAKLATIINKRFEKKLSGDKLKDKLKQYETPKNCDKLVVPRVNVEVWRQLNAYQKRQDIRFTHIQTALIKAATAMAQLSDSLLSAKANDNPIDYSGMITKATDAVALIGHSAYEISLKRREAMKPALKREYSLLCAAETPVTAKLFGEDISKTLKDIKQANQVGKDTSRKHYGHGSKNGFYPKFGRNQYNRRGRGGYQKRGYYPFQQPMHYNQNQSNKKKSA